MLTAWRLQSTVLAIVSTAIVASCDEYHQSFIPSRTGSPYDVLLDTCGASALCLLVWLLCWSRRLSGTELSTPLELRSITIASKRWRSVNPDRSYSFTAGSLPSVTVSVMASNPARSRLCASAAAARAQPATAICLRNTELCDVRYPAPTREHSTMPTSVPLRLSRSIQEKLPSKMPHPGNRTMLCRNRSEPCSVRYWSLISVSEWPA